MLFARFRNRTFLFEQISEFSNLTLLEPFWRRRRSISGDSSSGGGGFESSSKLICNNSPQIKLSTPPRGGLEFVISTIEENLSYVEPWIKKTPPFEHKA